MKKLLLGSLFLAAMQTGCVVIGTSKQPISKTKAKKCPPGHVWSDGKCHNTGKGHDKDKGKSGDDHGKGHDKD